MNAFKISRFFSFILVGCLCSIASGGIPVPELKNFYARLDVVSARFPEKTFYYFYETYIVVHHTMLSGETGAVLYYKIPEDQIKVISSVIAGLGSEKDSIITSGESIDDEWIIGIAIMKADGDSESLTFTDVTKEHFKDLFKILNGFVDVRWKFDVSCWRNPDMAMGSNVEYKHFPHWGLLGS